MKRLYLDAPVTDTVVTTRVDGVPHRVLRTPFVDGLEGSGRVRGLARALRHAAAFRRLSGAVLAGAAAGRAWPPGTAAS